MSNVEIQQFLSEIIDIHQGNIRDLESEIAIGSGRHTYQLSHKNWEFEFELFEKEKIKFSKVKIGDFKAEYPEGTEIFNLITELLQGI